MQLHELSLCYVLFISQRRNRDGAQRRIQVDGQESEDDDQRRKQDDTRNQDDAQARNKNYEVKKEL